MAELQQRLVQAPLPVGLPVLVHGERTALSCFLVPLLL